MADRKYDYPALREEFIHTPGLAIRELARRHNIAPERVSSLHAQARKQDERGRTWYDLQQEFGAKSDDAALEAAARQAGRRREKADATVDKVLDAIGAAAEAFKDDVKNNPPSARDLAVLAREISPLVRMIGDTLPAASPLPSRPDDHLSVSIPSDGSPLALLIGRLAGASGQPAGDGGGTGTRALPDPVAPRED